MAIPANYDASLQQFIQPPVRFEQIDLVRLRFLRWLLAQKTTPTVDGWVIGESSGEIVDFLAEKAKRETEASIA